MPEDAFALEETEMAFALEADGLDAHPAPPSDPLMVHEHAAQLAAIFTPN